MEDLQSAVEIVLKDCLAVESSEQVLLVVDKPLTKIGELLFTTAQEIGADVVLTKMLPRDNHGQEPPEMIAEAMKQADVVIMPTSKSLSHTQARIEANQAGARAVTLPGITEEIMQRTLTADYEKIKARSLQLAKRLSQAQEARVTAANGTDITMSLKTREGHPDTGIYHHQGDFGNLPAGEAYIAPLEGTATGKFVIDGSLVLDEVGTEEIELTVAEGYVTEIKGARAAKKLKEKIKLYGQEALNIAELGVGTNDQARISGNILEDEKVMGTIHIAIGDNSAMGGEVSVASHLDGIIKKPNLELDEEVVMENGKLLID
ncbi:aminopeptidase [Halanaerobaculum tunisiense]